LFLLTATGCRVPSQEPTGGESGNNPPIIEEVDPLPPAAVEDRDAVEAELQQRFAEKYNTTASAIRLTFDGITGGRFVRGSVQILDELTEECPSCSSGIFLAALVGDRWEIAFDGNGGISCARLEPYGFPSAMMKDCY
ncbi:MAG: hypothetical protein V1760_01295, partial [Candidatus Peregrinibacteria bacterium]